MRAIEKSARTPIKVVRLRPVPLGLIVAHNAILLLVAAAVAGLWYLTRAR